MSIIFNDDEEDKKSPQPPTDWDTLKKTRTIMISGEINKDLSDRFAREIIALEADSNKPVWVFINSPGGDVDAGFAIYDLIRFVSVPVNILGVGLVASAAALIYMAVPKANRYALPDSSYLIHQPLSELQGRAVEVEIYVKKMEEIKLRINQVIAEATGKRLDQVVADTDRDCWLTSTAALEYGIVGRVVEKRSQIK